MDSRAIFVIPFDDGVPIIRALKSAISPFGVPKATRPFDEIPGIQFLIGIQMRSEWCPSARS
jgi:hypothetical protein